MHICQPVAGSATAHPHIHRTLWCHQDPIDADSYVLLVQPRYHLQHDDYYEAPKKSYYQEEKHDEVCDLQ
jgi:hypothetical protein